MKITITTAPIRAALASVSKVVLKSPIDIMMAAHVEGKDGEIYISASSSYGDLRVTTGESCEQDFAFAVNADRLKQLVDRADSEELKIDIPKDESQPISISGGSVRGKIKQLPAYDFPGVFQPKGELLFKAGIPANHLNTVKWAANVAISAKPMFQGITLQAMGKGKLRVMSASGAGACSIDCEIDGDFGEAHACFSVQSAAIITGILDTCTVTATPDRIVFEDEKSRVSVPLLLSGQGILLKTPPIKGSEIAIDRTHMLEAVKLCSSMRMMAGQSKIMVARVTQKDDAITFFAEGGDGDISQDVAVTGKSKLSCNLNTGQIISALAACGWDNLTMVVPDDPQGPHALKAGPWSTLVMPVRM